MNPRLWGPGMWHMMLSIAWNCPSRKLGTLIHVLLHDIPILLPCPVCRAHYVKTHVALKCRLGEPTSVTSAFHWVYYLKDEVNKITQARPLSLADLENRLNLSGGRCDDVLVADTLMYIAIFSAKHENDDQFVTLCHNLCHLLPLPPDSQLLLALGSVRKPILSHAFRAYKHTRIEHGISFLPMALLRNLTSDD